MPRRHNVHSPDILDEIKACDDPPFRPKVAESACSPGLRRLMKSCLEENPARRPEFADIRKQCNKLGM